MLFAIDDEIKIIIGNVVKTIPIISINESANKQFFSKLFEGYEVLTFNESSLLSKDEFYSSLQEYKGLEAPESIAIETEVDTVEKIERPKQKEIVRVEEKSKPKAAQVIRKEVPKVSALNEKIKKTMAAKKPEVKKSSNWYKSQAESIIIIDDIYTGVKKRRGEIEYDENVIIYPNRATNFGKFNKEQVKESSIMRRLINDNVLVQCSEEEARELESEYQEKEANVIRDTKGINSIAVDFDGVNLPNSMLKDAVDINVGGSRHETVDLGGGNYPDEGETIEVS